jgi:hypothetical protein
LISGSFREPQICCANAVIIFVTTSDASLAMLVLNWNKAAA